MKKEILTDNGNYSYEEVELFLGRKIMDREISKSNILDFKKIMDTLDIRYGLMYGTLLGAIRDGDFIPWDEDIDIFVLEEDRKKVLNTLFHFEKIGMKVARYRGHYISIIRNNEYIDIYFYKKTLNNKRREGDFEVDARFLEKTEFIEFFGEKFMVPSNPKELLTFLYGDDWHIPKKNVKPKLNTLDRKVKDFFIQKTPYLYNIFKYLFR